MASEEIMSENVLDYYWEFDSYFNGKGDGFWGERLGEWWEETFFKKSNILDKKVPSHSMANRSLKGTELKYEIRLVLNYMGWDEKIITYFV